MEFPGGSDNYLAITGAAHPFLTGAETFHTPSLGDEEFELPPIALEGDPSLAVADVVGHFEDLGETGGGGSDPPFPPPPYGVQSLEMPVGIGHGLMEQGGGLLAGGLAMELDPPMGAQYSAAPPVTIDVPLGALSPGGLLAPGQLTTIDQSELSSQLGLSLGTPSGATAAAATTTAQGGPSALPPAPPAAPSPDERLSPTPSPTGSLQDDEPDDFRRAAPPKPSPPAPPAPPPLAPPPGEAPRRAKPPKKPKKKKDPNEPQKPLSAYALFFRDTQAAIKGQNPNATFGEVSKIVASMWDSLGEEQKQVYKRKTEAAKKEYLKALDAYRAILTSTEQPEPETSPTPPPPSSSSSPPPSSSSSSPDPPPPPPPTAVAPPNPSVAPPNPPVAPLNPSVVPPPPSITKIIIPKQMLPSSLAVTSQGGVVTVIPATVVTGNAGNTAPLPGGAPPIHLTPRQTTQIVTRSVLQAAASQLPRLQPPPLQQMPPPQPLPPPQNAPQAVLQPPPPLQAMQPPQNPPNPPKIRLALPPQQPPPPLQIKILPPPTAAIQIQTLRLPTEDIGGAAGNPQNAVAAAAAAASATAPLPQLTAGATSPEAVEMIAGDVVPEVDSPPQLAVELVAESPGGGDPDSPGPRCIRAGCSNAPVASGDWDEEYCSSECLIKHCRDVFLAWIAARNAGNSVVFVK
ncbi:TOX high mobility group box family member 4 [Cuculus canorus]|uniref:TOX high mobility group box family member 4 n=1 Tax=Cuculus canorus TaxID=55661 RepID=UPI0023AA4F35|nr:TOX high mobility group box family member 4 [Cuculus canorus]